VEECQYCGGDCPEQVTKNGHPHIPNVCREHLKTYMAKYPEYTIGDK